MKQAHATASLLPSAKSAGGGTKPGDGQRLHVGVFSTSFPRWRGDQNGAFVRDLIDCLLAVGGFQFSVYCLADAGVPTLERHENLRIRRLRYFWPASWLRLGYGPGVPWNIRTSWIARLNVPFAVAAFTWTMAWRGRRFDVIHANWGVLGALAVLTRPLHGRPIIVTIHGTDLRTSNKLIRRPTEFAIRRATVVLTTSPDFRDWCAQLRGPTGSAESCVFTPNGVRLPVLEEVERDRSAGRAGQRQPFRIVTTGRLVAERNIDVLLRAVERLRSECDVQVTIVGDGPALPGLEELAKELELEAFVSFPGRVAVDQVTTFLRRADLYVSPTSIETFGTAVVEAAAHGLPVVTTRVGFPAELVVEGQAGYVVEARDLAALTEAIARIARLPDQGRAMGRAMRRRVEELGMGLVECSGRVGEVYRQCLMRQPSAVEGAGEPVR